MEESIYCEALEVFGTTNQTIVAIEELSELQKELTKTLRGYLNRDHVLEEMADVEIMLTQMKIMLNIKELELESYKQRKNNRLKERIEQRKNLLK